MSIDYENPWIYNGKAFESSDIGDAFGFVYCISCNETQREYIGRKYFWQFRTPKGKKRKVKSESDWKKYYGSCPELKEEIIQLGKQNFSRTILSLHNTKAKQTSRKPDNFSSKEFLPSHLATEHRSITTVTSSQDTSEKTIMMLDDTDRW